MHGKKKLKNTQYRWYWEFVLVYEKRFKKVQIGTTD